MQRKYVEEEDKGNGVLVREIEQKLKNDRQKIDTKKKICLNRVIHHCF